MVVKKIFFYLVCMVCINQPISIFCMEESSEEEVFAKAILKSIQIDNWSKYFDSNETFEKSFVFDTENDQRKMIAIQTDKRTHFVNCSSKGPLKLHVLGDKFFENVERYIPTVYQEGDDYIFYVTKKKPALVFNEKYVVEKLAFKQGQAKPLPPIFLFEHNTPIMYLGEVHSGSSHYLVAGSFYPSIKIYDLQKDKVIKTLHNRFLLGANSDTLYFARKIERPYFGLGRRLAYDLDKQYNCTLHSLVVFHGNQESRPLENVSIIIDYNRYPFLIRWSSFIFDPNTNTIIDFNGEKQFDLSQLPINEIATGNKITFKKGDVNEKINKMMELFQDSNFLNIFKQRLTYDSFISFGNIYKEEHIVQSYFSSIIKPMVEKIIEPNSKLCNSIAQSIGNHLLQILNQLIPGGSGTIIFTRESFNSLEKALANKDFKIRESFWTKINTDLIQNTPIYQPKYILQEQVQNIHVDNEYIIIQRKTDIFRANMRGKNVVFEKWYTSENTIENSFIIDNTVFIIKKDGLSQLKIFTQSVAIQQESKGELYPPERVKVIKDIIAKLKLEENRLALKELFRLSNEFPINTLDNIPDFKKHWMDIITEGVKIGYIRPVLRNWISKIAEEYKTYFDDDELKNMVSELEHKISDDQIWFERIELPDILSDNEGNYLSKIQQNSFVKILDRFKNLNLASLESTNPEAYNKYLRLLNLLYGMETVVIDDLGLKKQTYFEYVRERFALYSGYIIKNLEIDAESILKEVMLSAEEKH